MFCYFVKDGHPPKVCMLHSESNFTHIRSSFHHMDEALKHSTYMFMIVTPQFCKDRWTELQRDECLMESIRNPDKRWCVALLLTVGEYLQLREDVSLDIFVLCFSALKSLTHFKTLIIVLLFYTNHFVNRC